MTNKKTKDEVYDDLYMLQSSQSYEIFQEGKRLFLKKWSTNKQVTNCLNTDINHNNNNNKAYNPI